MAYSNGGLNYTATFRFLSFFTWRQTSTFPSFNDHSVRKLMKHIFTIKTSLKDVRSFLNQINRVNETKKCALFSSNTLVDTSYRRNWSVHAHIASIAITTGRRSCVSESIEQFINCESKCGQNMREAHWFIQEFAWKRFQHFSISFGFSFLFSNRKKSHSSFCSKLWFIRIAIR